MQELEAALSRHAPPPVQDDPSRHELPPLVIDGIPTPVEKMTQAQLRAFIPLMLKYSTGEPAAEVLRGVAGSVMLGTGQCNVPVVTLGPWMLDSGGMSSQSYD